MPSVSLANVDTTVNTILTTGLTTAGNVTATGTVTATTFVGDGSQLTGLSQPMTLSNVQITDDNWVSIDDTALTSNVDGYCVVTGTNFAPGSIVTVGGTNASATSYASSTQLRVQAPSKASGSYTLSVIRSGDGASVSLPSAVTYSEGITWIIASLQQRAQLHQLPLALFQILLIIYPSS